MLRVKSTLRDDALRGFDPDFNPAKLLFEKDCFLKDYNFGANGLFIPAGNFINQYCKGYNINQRVILVTLQRETGLLNYKTIDEARENRIGFGLDRVDYCCCVGVPDNGSIKTKYAGFENQIAGASATYKHWFEAWKPEAIKELVAPDPVLLCIPENGITNSLLYYTPHIDALRLTERLFVQFFGTGFNV